MPDEKKPPSKVEVQKEEKKYQPVRVEAQLTPPTNPRKISSIVIALDNYDDIFSDFDTGPYQQRLISDDFLKEIQKRYMESEKGDIEVKLSLPESLRDPKVESTIKKRIRGYFNLQVKETESAIKKRRLTGILYLTIGFFFLALEYQLAEPGFIEAIPRAIGILLLPAGWFSMWNGLEYLIQIPEKMSEQKKLYTKFANAEYIFISEEELEEMEKKEQEKAKPQWTEQTRLKIPI